MRANVGRRAAHHADAGLLDEHPWWLQVDYQHFAALLPVRVLRDCERRLPASPRGLYEVRVAVQTSETPYSLQYQLFEGLKNGTEIPRGDLVTILSTPAKETESLEEFDFLDDVLPVVGETPLLHA